MAELRIEVGASGRTRHIGVQPPLTDEQQSLLRAAEFMDGDIQSNFSPVATPDHRTPWSHAIINALGYRSPEAADENVVNAANKIAGVLRNAGDTVVVDESIHDIDAGQHLFHDEDEGNGQEQGEARFSPAEVLTHFEAIGKKAEDRYAADYLDRPIYRHHELPAHGFDGIFALEAGERAQFHWSVSPTFYRPEHRLPGGSLTIKDKRDDGVEVTELFMFNRILEGENARVIVANDSYERSEEGDLKHVDTTGELLDQTKLKQIHDALVEIERAIDDPGQAIEWHEYGRSYVW